MSLSTCPSTFYVVLVVVKFSGVAFFLTPRGARSTDLRAAERFSSQGEALSRLKVLEGRHAVRRVRLDGSTYRLEEPAPHDR